MISFMQITRGLQARTHTCSAGAASVVLAAAMGLTTYGCAERTGTVETARAAVKAQFGSRRASTGNGIGDLDQEQQFSLNFMAESIFVSPDLVLQPNEEALPEDIKGERFGLLPAETEGDTFMVSVHHPRRDTQETEAEVFAQYIAPVAEAVGVPGALSTLQAEAVQVTGAGISKLQLRDPLMAMCADVRKVKKFSAKHPGGFEGLIEEEIQVAEGTTLDGFIQDLTVPQRHFVYRQLYEGTPVEGAMVVATAREGEGVHSVRGALYNFVEPLNSTELQPEDAQALGRDYIVEALGPESIIVQGTVVATYPTLVLLPSDVGHRYAWRTMVRVIQNYSQLEDEIPLTNDYPKGKTPKELFAALVWIDAEEGTWLGSSVVGGNEVSAAGRAFPRDPGMGPLGAGNASTETLGFQVDAASGGKYVLKLNGVHNQVDRGANGISTSGSGAEVSISSSSGGSSSSYANFNQSSINNANGRRAVCQSDANHNPAFTEVDLAASIQRFRSRAVGAGIITGGGINFPRNAWSPTCNDPNADSPGNPCNARAGMTFGYGNCFASSSCPNCSGDLCTGGLNFAHDHTVTAHEMAHNISNHQFCQRAGCGPDCSGTCGSKPIWHDVADGWAASYENTNCIAGWAIKNVGGVDNSLYCNPGHNEGGGLPRVLNTADRFPDHRDLNGDGTNDNTGEYANSQIASYAVWEVRKGMESRCPPSGVAAFERRFMLALQSMSYSYSAPSGTDRHLEQGLRDLLREMVAQWASSTNTGTYENGSPSTNKVTAGFAKAGVFLSSRDAVIDVLDNDAGDNDEDWLDRDDGPPSFQVWTGREYSFSSDKAVPPSFLGSCNERFRVYVSTSPTFAAGSTVTSDWLDAVDCKGTYTLPAANWATMKGAANTKVQLYYKVETEGDGIAFPGFPAPTYPRVSTQPGIGAFSVPAPYAVINDTGTAGGCSTATSPRNGTLLAFLALGLAACVRSRRRKA